MHDSADASAPRNDAPAASPGLYRWALVGMLWFICFFNYADRQAISSVLPVLEQEYGFSKSEQGLIGGAFMWIYGASAPLAGMIGDRASRKWLIIGGLYVWSAVTGLTALCSKVWHFVAVRGAEGLGETFYFPATLSLVSDYHGHDTRSRAMALHQSAVYAGIIGGGALTGLLAESYGWRFPFVAFGVAGIVLGLVLAKFVHEPQRNAAERAAALRDGDPTAEESAAHVPWLSFAVSYITRPASLSLLLSFVGANVVAGVLYVWLTTFIKNKFDTSLTTAAFTGTVYIQLAAMAGSVCGGFLADSWRQRWLGGRVAVQALGILCGTPLILVCALSNQLLVVIVGMIALGFCKGVYDSNIWASIYEVVPASRRSSAVGLANMVGWGGAGVGSYLLGLLVDSGVEMSLAFAWLAAIYAAVAMTLWFSALVLTPRHIRAASRGA